MPWRLLFSLIGITLLICFIGFNADHTSDISFGFYTFEDVRIFISLFASFLLGALVVFPYAVVTRKKREKDKPEPKKKPIKKAKQQTPGAVEDEIPQH